MNGQLDLFIEQTVGGNFSPNSPKAPKPYNEGFPVSQDPPFIIGWVIDPPGSKPRYQYAQEFQNSGMAA